jgi:hypothetical protein
MRYFEKRKRKRAQLLFYVIVHKRDEFLKSNLKRELSECYKVILRIKSDMNKNSFTQNCVLENVLWVF